MSKQKKIKIDDFAFSNLADVAEGYQFWCRTLLEKASNKYEYFTNDGTDLPKNLNFGALQQCAVWNGMAPVIDYKKLGLVATCNTPMYIGGSLTGYDINGLSVLFNCSNPSLPGAGTFSIYPQCDRAPAFPELPKKCVILYNSTIDTYGGYYGNSGLKMLICRYARLLADIDASISIATVNTRLSNIVIAPEDAVAKSVETLIEKVKNGAYGVVAYDDIMKEFKSFALNNVQGIITELQELKEKVIVNFCEDIGVNKVKEKAERMIVPELSSNKILLVNIEDELACAKEFCKNLNECFGTNIDVRIKPEYDPQYIIDESGQTLEIEEESETEEIQGGNENDN